MRRRPFSLLNAVNAWFWWCVLHRDLYRLLRLYNVQFGRDPREFRDLTAQRLRVYWPVIRSQR